MTLTATLVQRTTSQALQLAKRNALPALRAGSTPLALTTPRRMYSVSSENKAQNPPQSVFGIPVNQGNNAGYSTYFQKPSLPANTIIRFVPQQTAWIVERMGKFHKILEPGLAIMIPFLDRIAYVKSLKEVALEIPSQSAITADNVTLDLDGVLFTRVMDAHKAR
jgi:hypothetical protein